jgi:hypothetical protein
MNCPPAVARVLLDILQQGILMTRSFGWSGDANRCAVEADHIHNLPSLLAGYSPQLLRYYWDVERRSFMSHFAADELAHWTTLWQRLWDVADFLHDSPRPA